MITARPGVAPAGRGQLAQDRVPTSAGPAAGAPPRAACSAPTEKVAGPGGKKVIMRAALLQEPGRVAVRGSRIRSG
jgi:hypothetical protein